MKYYAVFYHSTEKPGRGNSVTPQDFTVVDKSAMCILTGKINNVIVAKHNDLIIIFDPNLASNPTFIDARRVLIELPDKWGHEFSIKMKDVFTYKSDELVPVCPKCTQYARCISDNFNNCSGAPKTTLDKSWTDFSQFEFVNERLAGWPYNLRLSADAVERAKNVIKLRTQRRKENRDYRSKTCSRCVYECYHFDSDNDRCITPDLVARVYDVFIESLFGSVDCFSRLRCLAFSNLLRGVTGGLYIVPFVDNTVLVQTTGSSDVFAQVILDSSAIERNKIVLSRNNARTLAYRHGIFKKILVPPSNFYYSQPKLSTIGVRCHTEARHIPGTNVPAWMYDTPLTDEEVLHLSEVNAGILATQRRQYKTFIGPDGLPTVELSGEQAIDGMTLLEKQPMGTSAL